jgi:REP element-mobilizing transposase RayT
MANTYSQIYIQAVFAVKRRETLIDKAWRQDLFRYTTGVVQGQGQKILAVGGVEDHIHIFFGYNNLTMSIPDLVRETRRHIKFCKKVKLTVVHLLENPKEVKTGFLNDILKIRVKPWLGKMNL